LGEHQLLFHRSAEHHRRGQLARELREKTLNIIASQAGMREYYNSQSGEAPGSAAPIFGWSAAVFIELAIQEYLETSNKNDG
jgi:putative isomerase